MTARRPLLVLLAFAALSAWVAAQGPGTGLTAADSLRMLRANRVLLDDLTGHGLALGGSNTPLDRAAECQKLTDRLGREVSEAVRANDADRLAEVSDHLNAVATDGLAPNLKDADGSIPPQSVERERLKELHQRAFDSLTRTADAVPTTGELGTSPRAKSARQALAAAAAAVGPPANTK